MSSYSEKLLINCVHADPGGCMCIIYFLDSKCDTFSLLANTHDPQNRFQKLNEIHRRRFIHWNCHTGSLTFVARSYHCHQALAMINIATNDSLANWIVLWKLTYPVLLVKALRLLIQQRNGRWMTDLCPTRQHFLSLRWVQESQESTLLDNRAPIQIWIWWWINC